jgi:hypothetical protein
MGRVDKGRLIRIEKGISARTMLDFRLPPNSRRDRRSSAKMGPIGFPETSVTSYHYTLRNISAERKSLLGLLGTESDGARVHRNLNNHAPSIQVATREKP